MGKHIIKQVLICFFVSLVIIGPSLAQISPGPREKHEERAARIDQTGDTLTTRAAQNNTRSQDQAQRRVDLEFLARAENRADGLRAQLANLQMRESELQARIEELDYQMKPESIQRALALVGSARPMDELRANLRARLESEKRRTNAQLEVLATTRIKLETALREAEAECARLRQRLGLSNDEHSSL